MYRTKLIVKGMYCGHCVMELQGALSEIGAENIQIDQASGKTQFDTREKPEISDIVKAVRKYKFEPNDLGIEKIQLF